LMLLFGPAMFPFLLVSPLLADILHQQFAMPWPLEILSSLLIGGVYSIALIFLLRPKMRFDPALSSMRDLVLLMLVAVVSAAILACCYVSLTVAAGLLPISEFLPAALRYWVGDVIGVMVVAPFALFALTRRRLLPISIETVLQFASIGAAFAVVFSFSGAQRFQLFYVLFLPIVWIAVRTGSEGVSAGILVTQLGLILGVQFFPGEARDLTALQALMLVLAMTGLVAGELVTERRRTESQLWPPQEALARLGARGRV